MMMTANLVGFVIGTEGISYLLNELFSTWEGMLPIVVSGFFTDVRHSQEFGSLSEAVCVYLSQVRLCSNTGT